MQTNLLHPARNAKMQAANFLGTPPRFHAEYAVFNKNLGRIKFRPIRKDDEARMVHFHESLSEESIYLRYFEHISLDTRTLPERLARVCTNTADSFGIVAELPGRGKQPAKILAVGRLTTTEIPRVASFAALLRDGEDPGVARELLKHLIATARAHDFCILSGELLFGDHDMLELCRSFGFTTETNADDSIIRVSYPL
jgi:acetyltransferase